LKGRDEGERYGFSRLIASLGSGLGVGESVEEDIGIRLKP
jgi:hypothetical protein